MFISTSSCSSTIPFTQRLTSDMDTHQRVQPIHQKKESFLDRPAHILSHHTHPKSNNSLHRPKKSEANPLFAVWPLYVRSALIHTSTLSDTSAVSTSVKKQGHLSYLLIRATAIISSSASSLSSSIFYRFHGPTAVPLPSYLRHHPPSPHRQPSHTCKSSSRFDAPSRKQNRPQNSSNRPLIFAS